MKYFTEDWYRTRNDWQSKPVLPGPIASPWTHYARHLEEMEGILPDDLLTLARLPGFDDALIVLARHDRTRRLLSLTLRAGDAQMGYYDLVLHYQGADISAEHERVLALIARTTKSDRYHMADAVWHELDVTDDRRIEHRLLFQGWRWFGIRCEKLQWVKIPKRDRNLPRRSDRFPGGPVTSRLSAGERGDVWSSRPGPEPSAIRKR